MITALNVDKLRLEMGEYVLSVQNLVKRAGSHRVLDGVDLDVKRGAWTALIGPPGAGKSVMLACIVGAAKPTTGRVRYFGYEMRGRAQTRVARMGIVLTHQTPQAFGALTVLETVTLGALLRRGRLDTARAHAREIAAGCGLSERLATPFAALSDLERRRLELARALATDPQLLLLDDLAGGLDPAGVDALGATLAEMRSRGITIVAAARSRDTCPLRPDDIVEIARGTTARTPSVCVY